MGKSRYSIRFRPYGGASSYLPAAAYGASKIGNFIKRGVALRARQFSANRTLTRTASSGRSGTGVTVQRDSKLIYRKRRMPRRKRRRWMRFVKKVNAVDERELGTRTVVNNISVTTTNNVSGSQGLFNFGLYTGASASFTYANDLSQIAYLENTGDPTAAAGVTVDKTTKIMFHSAILDCTFRNTSTYFDGDTYNKAEDFTLEVDVYEITSNRQFEYESGGSVTNASTPVGCFTAAATDTKTISGSGSALQLGLRGVSPWDLPQGLSQFGLKILKKTKYTISYGQTFTYQVRDPKRRVTTYGKLKALENGNVPKWTKWLLVIFKSVPGSGTIGTTADTYQEVLTVGFTRKYMYKIEGANEDRDIYNVA